MRETSGADSVYFAAMDVRALILRTAGTNCDGETVRALELAGARADLVYLGRAAAEPGMLDDYRVLVLPGGFSYGDYVAAGRVFGIELKRALAGALAAFVRRGGLVLGICNGFQVLLEAGLFDGGDGPAADGPRDVALYGNESDRFECRWVSLRAEECACPWLTPGQLLPVPVAHAEGRLAVRSPAALERLRRRGQIAFRYARGGLAARPGSPEPGPVPYPDCPNGSVDAIAGLCDPTGRVLGLMPHPERNVTPWHHPHWTRLGERSEGEGLPFFRSLVEYAAQSAHLPITTED